jgi:hypothetical protein
MSENPRLRERIRLDIQLWLNSRGNDFILDIKEFCQGNRAALTRVLRSVEELGIAVFIGENGGIDQDLLEKLEYGIFDLIGKFSSTPGGLALENSIKKQLLSHLTDIFAEAKRQWNLEQYKITASYEELDPNNCLIPASSSEGFESEPSTNSRKVAKQNARLFIDELIVFAKGKLRGEKNVKIAVNWLENPEKLRDYGWLAALTNSSTGTIKVTLTRLKHTLCRNYRLKYVGDELELDKIDMLAGTNPN